MNAAASFLERLGRLGPLLRAALGPERLRARFTVRSSPPEHVVLDMHAARPATERAERAHAEDVVVAAAPDVWNALLSGAIRPGAAFGRRELLVRGTMAHLVFFLPLFDLAPALFVEYTGRRNGEGRMKRPGLFQRAVIAVVGAAAWLGGYLVAVIRYRVAPRLDLLDVLERLQSGAMRGTPKKLRPKGK